MRVPLDLCLGCGKHVTSELRCNSCGSDLRVDLWAERAPKEARTLLLAARDLAGVLPGTSFSAMKRALAAAPACIAKGVSRPHCAWAIEALAQRGIPASALPPSGRPRTRWLAGLAALLVAGATASWVALPSGAPPASIAGQDASPSQIVKQARRPGRAGAPLTTAQISTRATPSLAVLTCHGRLGTGFFIDPEHAVTNAHVTCEDDPAIDVKLTDGRRLLGRVVKTDVRLDLALVEVPGAAARPLELGDSTLLTQGEQVVIAGNPSGLAFTIHEAKVSYVGRSMLGVAYIQINGDVNPGNSGGPLLDSRGRAVGVVSIKITGADALGLALPIEYVRDALGPELRASPETTARWQRTLAQVAQEERQAENYTGRFKRPTLMEVSVRRPWELVGVVARRWDQPPSQVPVTIEIRDRGRLVCEARGTVSGWVRIEDTVKSSPNAGDRRRELWVMEHQFGKNLYAGALQLDVKHCPLEGLSSATTMAISGGESLEPAVRFPHDELRRVRPRADQTGRRIEDTYQPSPLRAGPDETALAQRWRDAFRSARQTLSELEVQRARPRSPEDRRDLEQRIARARDDLADLEHRAAQGSIPADWRE